MICILLNCFCFCFCLFLFLFLFVVYKENKWTYEFFNLKETATV